MLFVAHKGIVWYCQYHNIYLDAAPIIHYRKGKIMEKKLECPKGIPEENCDHAPHCNVWKLREKAKNQA